MVRGSSGNKGVGLFHGMKGAGELPGQLYENVGVLAGLRHPAADPPLKRGPATVSPVLALESGEQLADRYGMSIDEALPLRKRDGEACALACRTDAAWLGVGGAKVACDDGLPCVDRVGLSFGLHGMGWVEVIGKGNIQSA